MLLNCWPILLVLDSYWSGMLCMPLDVSLILFTVVQHEQNIGCPGCSNYEE